MNDLISRQAAIDIERNATVDTNPSHFEAHQKFKQFMDDAEISSFGRWQWSNGFNTALTAVGIDLKKLPSAQRWIPCDKGEPDEDMECWVTVKTTDTLYRGNFTKRYGERRDKGFITSGGFMWWNTALAWMPIYEPEPYRPEGDDKHEG